MPVEGAHPYPIAGAEHQPSVSIPNCDCEVTIEAGKKTATPPFIRPENEFAVGPTLDVRACSQQIITELGPIPDRSIDNEYYATVVIA
jgi:hypothetical protein